MNPETLPVFLKNVLLLGAFSPVSSSFVFMMKAKVFVCQKKFLGESIVWKRTLYRTLRAIFNTLEWKQSLDFLTEVRLFGLTKA